MPFKISLESIKNTSFHSLETRNTRRETKMTSQWTGQNRGSVSFNEKCQAVGPNSNKFNDFLGTLA